MKISEYLDEGRSEAKKLESIRKDIIKKFVKFISIIEKTYDDEDVINHFDRQIEVINEEMMVLIDEIKTM